MRKLNLIFDVYEAAFGSSQEHSVAIYRATGDAGLSVDVCPAAARRFGIPRKPGRYIVSVSIGKAIRKP